MRPRHGDQLLHCLKSQASLLGEGLAMPVVKILDFWEVLT